jgi:hypothetical protein
MHLESVDNDIKPNRVWIREKIKLIIQLKS